ncbi:hypothetical protein B0H14DRAFT_801459 [Mycena olivaceomarginata]|nr:hypothetical protein B0H14DRAFT_801459 [Mycena olivaceomarginata]
MCWPRAFCCRCPRPSSFPWPPSLTFGRTPRRPQLPQASFSPWSPSPAHPPPQNLVPWHPNISTGPPPRDTFPVIGPPPRQRRVQFVDDDLPPLAPALPLPQAQSWLAAHAAPILLPSPQAWPTMIHPELCAPRGVHPFLDWDLIQFPSTAQLRSAAHASPAAAALDSPALHPPAALLTLSYADTPLLAAYEARWGPIVARAQGAHALTVGDVLDAIHAYFAVPLSPADRAELSAHAWGVVSDAYRRRVGGGAGGRSPNLRAYDERRGAVRADVLNGATKFAGVLPRGRGYVQLMLSAY